MATAVNIHGQDVGINFLSNMERSLVEAHDAVISPEAFWEYHHVIAVGYCLADFLCQHVHGLLDAHEACQFK